jgi:hypothetical protein
MRSFLYDNLLSAFVLASMATLASAQFAPPLPSAPADLPPPAVVAPPVAIPVRPLTLGEFAASFKPLPGKYEVLLVHPKTGCPVKVCFTLPPGCVRCVRANGHKIVFDYKCQHDVVIRFLHGGKVWVRG